VQEPELFEHQEQEDDYGAPGIKEILPQVPQTPSAQGNQVNWKMPDPGA
jgi:hypothetical protein